MSAAPARRDIAIVGVGVRLPGADSLAEFWEHLAAGRSLITEVPPRRWDKAALRGDPAKGNNTASIWGGFVADADCFDAAFFNISPREAAWMDPQQRFALELAWQAIEDAGYRAGSLAGSRTGVFMGVCHWDYAELLEKHLAQIDAYLPTGIAFSIIANRVSHFFDFRGPSITNDTACAASLTSVHEAVQALRAGSCDLALAGGVNLIWSPNHFVAFSKNGMLSRDGASKAFDERADGYVRGEGGAMLLLKPLEQALADGDAIHAVIRGSGVNHGGHTNSLTVTSPQAQADLVAGVVEAAGVAPDSIGYIEAHGTGTPLGDPIEIAGLKQAFGRLYAAAGREPVAESCGIGSVKTNIGHLEGAAGVAGIVKVLGALEHEALPANVDFGTVNALIRLEGTPFRIQRELSAWPRRPGQPRRAGVSAFGFGGSNAHVVIEEAPAGPDPAPIDGDQWIPLSARDEGRLAEMARRLLAWLEGPGAGVDLADLAWTLQQGREAMAARALWRVADLPALKAALADFIRAGADSAVLHRPAAEAPQDDDAAVRWLAGEGVAWPAPLTPQSPRRRLHLPTYPFARERHWMDAALGAKDPEPVVHPLLHRNLSRLGQQRYRTPLAGSEFFWADHHVGTTQVLPGVVCLEMARAAWAQAMGRTGEAALACDIGQVVWARPVLAGEALARLEIRLEPPRRTPGTEVSSPAEELHFDIAQLDGAALPDSPNAQGSIAAAAAEEPEVLDLTALRAQATAASLTPAQLYARLAATGMHHGPAFRAVAGLHAGDGYLLVHLKLPRLLRATLDSFVLHPVMLDAAIQAWIGLESAEGAMTGAAVPFSCGRVAVRGACSDAMWALLKPIGRQEGGLRRFDIALADRDGRVRLRFHDLALRVMAAEEAPAPLVSVPRWEPAPLIGAAETPVQTRVLLAGFDTAAAEALRAACGLPIELLPEPAESADAGDCALAWFEALRERIAAERGRREPVQWLALLPAETHEPAGSALAALFRCMAAEQPRLAGAVVRVAAALAPARLAAILQAEAARRDGYSEIRYDAAGQRSVLRPAVVELPAVPPTPFPAPGVVLVTGGAGGLGRHFRTWLAARGVARIVVAGRAAAPAGAISHDADGPQVFYRSCDVADPAQVRALVDWIGAELGPLKGIIHGAGLLRDGYLINKPAGEAATVFAPKVRGALNLDAATRDLPLDFFLLCSSIAATLGNPGQADYAAANAFMDAFAAARSRQVAAGERHGLTVAVAWPLWADGGMSVDGPSLKALQRRFGSMPLPTEVALAALDAILADGQHPCVTLHYGAAGRIRQVLADFGAAPDITPAPAAAVAGTPGGEAPARLVQAAPADGELLDRTVDWLKDLLGELIQMEPAKIRTQARLEEYGIDSIVIVEMTARMEEDLGPLPKTLFFEYVDLAGVAGYLTAEKVAPLAALFAAAGAESATASAAEEISPPAPQPASETDGQADGDAGAHDIAIVGLSLHVAGADDQESFWRMLEQGQHAFRRVPGERWNHEALVHPERDVLGKTVVQTGAFLDGIDRFDPRYFRISQAEAELMSPEVRLFLQTSVEAFEDAGYSRETLQRKYGGNVAVIVGTMTNDYNLYGFQNMLQRGALASGSYTGTVPNMVSYYYGFTGPSYFLDTMCSAAATCVHEAVHMLRSGRAPMVLAGGLSLLLHPQKLIATSQEHFTSKTAEVIRGYGQGADGTILGEGVGALVLKRLADAERDGDHIYGVIKGTGISNAGVRNGFTVPNPRQQAAAIEQALADSGLPPETIGYIEGHGSGTALGDPIEVKALTEAYGRHMTARQGCPIGTVKSNVAHLLGAAALPGIVKVLLQMQRGKLAPSLHAETLNPNIPFADTPFYVQRELAEWTPRRDATGRALPRRAGVTSIGAGGINVHLILEEHGPAAPAQEEPGPALCVFSAMTPERLRALLERFDAWLAAHPDAPLADLAWTLQTGRNELPCRFAVVAQDVAQLRQALSRFRADGEAGEGAVYTPTILDRDPRVDAAKVGAALAGRQLAELARWWADGVVMPWEKQPGANRRRRLSLPSYPFESVRCWYASYPDAPSVVTPLGPGLKLHPFVGRNLSDRHGLRYATDIHLGELLDYVFTWKRQQQLLPVVVAEMAAAVAREAGFGTELALHGLEAARAPDWSRKAVLSATVLDEDGAPLIELSASEGEGAPAPFARVRLGDLLPAMPQVDLVALDKGSQRRAEEVYRQLAESQLGFRPYLEVIETLWPQADGGALCRLRGNPPQQDHFKRDVFLPAPALGAAWQMMALLRPESARHAVARIDSLRFGGGEVRYLLLRPAAGDPAAWDLLALTEAGGTVAALLGLRLAPPEQLAWSAPEPARALAAAMPAARLDGGAPLGAAQAIPATADATDPAPAAPQDGARAAFSLGLRELAGELLKFPPADINPRSPFYDLGFDSISLTRLANEINARYGSSLTPAIFYECEHIDDLAGWLAIRHPEAVAPVDAPNAPSVPNAPPAPPASPMPETAPVTPAAPAAARPVAGVAIVGLALRLPGSPDAESFFAHLLAGDDLVGSLPLERYSPAYRARMEAAGFPLQGGFLADIDRFDAAFFKATPHEACRMDPQQRLLLETAQLAVESAGYRPDELPAATGVFVGVSGRDYASLLQAEGVAGDAYVATGNSLAMVANRVSWQFNLHGPSEAVDTACSSSLVALMGAVDAIRQGRCSMALAAGVNLALAIEGFEGPWQAGMLSPTARCRSFAAEADGYVRGEGVVVLLLKDLVAAERDGDAILGLVAGGAVNHGGHAGSLTAPSARAQADLVAAAMAGVDPRSIGYIETHGTGTPLGDPVEINGLRLAYDRLAGEEREKGGLRIGLGSVKSNVGHLEAAAGLAGVAKVLLALAARELPPTLHCANINPYVELAGSPFHLVRSRQPWPAATDGQGRPLPRRAGVSSFGFGGSNAHVILEAYEGPAMRRRPALPRRTFADTRYWVPSGSGAPAAGGEGPSAAEAASAPVLLAPVWLDEPLATAAAPLPRRLILSCEFDLGDLGAGVPDAIPVPPLSGDAGQRYGTLAEALLLALQQALRQGGDGPLLVQLLVPRDAARGFHAGLGALLDSAGAEVPRLLGQVVEVPADLPEAEALAVLEREARQGGHRRIRYRDGRRFVRTWQDLPAAGAAFSWRPGGVYLISGGLGALGRHVARDILARAPGAHLVLLGRSPLDDARRALLPELATAASGGATLRYEQIDIGDPGQQPAVAALVRDCIAQYGALHGVIHCAGIHRDSALIRKTPAQLQAVLAPKVRGALALLAACRGLSLDGFVLFSSLAGAVGNAGQADYAAANGFLAALAEWEGAPLLAIDWPLWREGGMRVDPAGEQAFFERMGQRPLDTRDGLAALGRCLAAGQREVAVVAGEGARIRAFFREAARLPCPGGAGQAASGLPARRAVAERLTGLLADISGLAAGAIEADAPLENYGIDSLMINRLNQALGERFGRLSKTLFFECRTLAQVADHLLAKHPDACAAWAGPGVASAAPLMPSAAPLAATPAAAGDEPIAVIGMSGRYPGAADLDGFWANLAAGRECVDEIPAERWPLEGFYEADPDRAVAAGRSYARRGGFLESFADFDPLFFRISPREAAAMDPQERLFLMEAWSACEDAGYPRARLARQHGGRVGVFAGVTKTGYAHYAPWQTEGGSRVRPVTCFASIANRVSFCLDLHGPSLPIDTMCSASLTAVHEACEHLRRGDCEVALAGGVNLYLHPDNYIELSAARMLSPDGHCRSFGAGGKGFVPGEGVGCLVLKPLSRALADGDRVHGVILGSAINHGGNTAGYTVPNPHAQAAVVREALGRAGVDGGAIGYIEAHGTGTELGDPIEFTGLCQAFGEGLAAGTCALGSVKSSIGHLEAAAGIAGLTKVLLQMRHRQLVPTLHAEPANPHLDLAASPFRLQTRLASWEPPSGRGRLLAGVSSFGAGGANAHVVVAAPDPAPDLQPAADATPGIQAVVLSARDPERLRAYAERLLAFLAAGAAQPAAAPGTPGQPSAIDTLRRLLADILSVEPGDIDPAEPFDSYGIEPVHRHALRRGLEQALAVSPAPAEVESWNTLNEAAAALPAAPAAGREAMAPVDLADLAWTLQIGREAMEHRLAILAASPEELAASLTAWLAAPTGQEPAKVLRGSVEGRKGALGLLADEPDMQGLLGRWLAQGDLRRVLGLWVNGLDVDWRLLPRPRPPRIVSAPTYPFARQRFWLPARPDDGRRALAEVLAKVQPGREALLAEQEELEGQLARLIGAVSAEWPPVPESTYWPAWRTALDGLQAPAGRRNPASAAEAWAAWDAYRARVAAAGGPLAQIDLVGTVVRALPDILAGRRPATEVMFPAGRMDLVEPVYKQNAVANRFNAALAAAAAVFVASRAAGGGAGLRILEIGAGTGGTTGPVLQALAPWSAAIAEYRYTDVSRAFLIHAERTFRAQVPWLQTALFDVEQPLAGQALAPGRYDLVIAANVLHATRRMDATLATVRDLLAPGGLLLVNETSRATLFTHLTFGLLDGWWRFADPERRIPGTPSLSPASWRQLAEETGLAWIGASAEAETALGQQVWATARPGDAVPLPAPEPSVGAPSPAAVPVRSAGRNADAGTVQGLIVEALAATLNLAPAAIDPALSFADYGLDSILGAEFVHRLRQHPGVRLAQTDLFDYPSVIQLAGFLEGQGIALAPTPTAAACEGPGGDEAASRIAAAAQPAAPAMEREPIAIVGYSGRFAGSPDPEALWRHLRDGDDLVRPVTRFDLAPFYRDAAPGSWCNRGSFIDDVDRFDARFFNISGLEATYMDPQQRLFLEEAWRTLEHAGHAGADMEGRRCGVFVGAAHGDYQELFRRQPPGQAFWGNTCSLIPARIAYYLNLKGPAVAVDTACSSSLVAIHLACHSLWAGESEMALAGGVFVQASPRFYRYANQANMLSPSGRCAAFGADADGIVPGEAVAAVLLRPLSRALADGDSIHGLIVASGINQDGATNGITAPSALSQEQLIREVYARYGIDPARIGLVEAHGTGTPLGDPIEYAALTRAYRGWTDATGYCALGSIKSNLGHATTAAGIAGVLKVLLALKHGQIPPTLHASPPNPALFQANGLADSPFYLNDRPADWPARPGQPRLAAVSSFGFGGTNAHAVIEEGPAAAPSGLARPAWLFVLSARSTTQLQAQARRLAEHLDAEPAQAAGDIAYTLAVGRRHGLHRLALVAADRTALAAGLAAWLAGRPGPAGAGLVGDGPPPSLPAMPDAAGADGAVWRQALDALALAYLGGQDDAPALQFGTERGCRVPLPTTVFEGKSFWVGETSAVAPEAPATEAPAPQTALSAAPAPRTAASLPLRLASPAACVVGPAAPRNSPPVPVRLAPLTAPAVSAEPSVPRLRRLSDAAGVRHLELIGPWDGRLTDELAAELAAVATDESVHAVCLTGDWQGAAAVPDFAATAHDLAAPLACPVPVVAALEAGGGAALVLAAHGDFLVLADGGRYGVAADLPAQAAALLQRRFGAAGLGRLRAGEGIATGSALAAGALVVPAGTTEARALELARRIAAAPRLALVELKRHMRSGPQAPDELPPPALGSELLAAGPADAAERAAWGAGRRLELASPVMELTLFADGVALLSMGEREHKNCFTPAFMAGMEEAFARLAKEPDCKVLVLTGHDAYFACGGTREGLESLQRGDTRFTDQRIYTLPLDFPLPVIAAMQGHAIGAGWSLGLFCDLALFAAESVYHSNYLDFGFTPGAGATLVFPRRLGDDLGREVLFSAREYKGRELAARSASLPVFPAAEVLPRALAVAHRLAAGSRGALESAKAAAAAPLRERIEGVLARELAMHEKTFIGNPLVKARIASRFAQEPAAPTAAASATAASRGSLRRTLVESLAEELMMDAGEIRDADGFLALGLDSILAVTWVRKLNALLDIDLPATCIYAHPSVGALLAEVARLRPVAPAADVAPSLAPPPVAVPAAPSFAESKGSLRRTLVESLAEELMMDAGEIRDADGFLALGLDSILAVTWIRKLNARLGIELPATCIYAHPTVGALLAEVARLLPAAPAAVPAPLPAPVPAPAPVPTSAAPSPPVTEAARRISAGAGPEDAIAIIGAAGRFPKAADLEAFWANLRAGVDGIVEVPASRWDIAEYFDPDPQAPGKSYSKWLGAIDDIDLFDAAFFNITAREAELMDPQQRLFLQYAWHALEDAAIDPSTLAGCRCGIFVGSGDSGYGDRVGETNAYSLIGKAGSILAARIAYLLDLRGAAIAIDTACSTSLVAIAAACDSLVLGTSDLALAGGACVLLGPQMYVDTCKVGMLSPDGHCHSFDQRANGFVPGEGVGVVLLKRLADAERDGDPIRAVIRGWGVNQDGRTNGITAPNPVAQGELLREVYRRFDIAPASIGLVEAHGTGTPLGDPIEIEGLRAGFGEVAPGTTVALGSVKSNIGHLLASAGVAGALKAMLAVERGELPPSIHFERANEHLALAGSPFRIQTQLAPWPAGGRRRAAVSAFGFSGTNAHLVLEDYPAPSAGPAPGGELLCVLSARSRNQLAAQAAVLAAHVEARPALDLADLCWTLQAGRQAFECRAAFVFAARDELLARLRALAAGETPRGVHLGGDRAGEAETWFAGDADARALLDKWLAAGELERVAKLWAQGAALDWRCLPGAAARHRLHLPGYAFARERHWVKAAAPAPTLAAALPVRGAAGDRRFVVPLRGDEAWLSRETDGAGLRLPGGFLAELARAAGELATGRPVGLGRLVWGPPLEAADLPAELVVQFDEDGEGWRYRIARTGAAGELLQVGELLPAADARDWPAPPALPADAADGLLALRHARPGARGIASLLCGAEVWRAGWSCPPGDPQPACALLDAIGQLAAGRDDAAGLAGPRFPLALEALHGRGAAPREGWIWLWTGTAGITVLVTDTADRPCLWLEGLVNAGLDALPFLHIDSEETS